MINSVNTEEETLKSMRRAWSMTRQRCQNPNQRDYAYYGGRGIKVCDRWLNFSNFLADMGLRPDGMTLERRDNDGDYEPGNCEWATRKTQSSNTRKARMVTWQGRTQCVSEWERELGMKPGTLKARIGALGYSIEAAMLKPVRYGAMPSGQKYKRRKPTDMSKVQRGMVSPLTRLSREDAVGFRARWLNGETFSHMAREFGVCVETMSTACQGQKAYQGVHNV